MSSISTVISAGANLAYWSGNTVLGDTLSTIAAGSDAGDNFFTSNSIEGSMALAIGIAAGAFLTPEIAAAAGATAAEVALNAGGRGTSALLHTPHCCTGKLITRFGAEVGGVAKDYDAETQRTGQRPW